MRNQMASDTTTPTTTDSVNTAASTQGDNRIRTLQYPIAGGNSHYVRFYINVNEESRLIKNKVVGTTGPVDNSQQSRANRNQASADAINAAGATVGAIKGAQLASGWSAYGLKKLFGTNVPMSKSYKAGSIAAAGLTTVAGAVAGGAAGYAVGALANEPFNLTNKLYRLTNTISLYTPGTIETNYSMDYSITDDMLTDLAQQNQYDSIKKSISSPGDWMKDIGKAARIAAATTKTASMLSKTAVNPKRDIMFNKVNNRQFSFTYTFAPRNAAEANAVADIIYMFKYFSHPEMLPGYGNFLYLYPAEFDLEFGIVNSDGSESVNTNINKISSCVLENMQVNYSPNGSFQTLVNGEPVITVMTLNFKEIETLHQGRIQAGY